MGGVPFGTQLMINGHVYTVEDRGTSYGHVDIYFDNHQDAVNFGMQYADQDQIVVYSESKGDSVHQIADLED